MNLAERYRPSTWGELIGQERVKRVVDHLRTHGGLGGRAYWISGKSGQGKSTIAWLLAREIADDLSITEITGCKLSVERLDEISRNRFLYGGLFSTRGKLGKAYIVNEAHGTSGRCMQMLLDILEAVPEHVMWIFTTTEDGQLAFIDGIDAKPFLSRCTKLELTSQGLAKAFAERAQQIAQAEGLDGKPASAYLRLVNDCGGNMRDALNRIEALEMLA